MWFPSSSWGKLGNLEEYANKYLSDNKLPFYADLNEEQLKEIINDTFSLALSRTDIMKKILEGRKMPVLNPKTGEEDYVDITLVDKIVVDSEYVEDMMSNNKMKIDIKLSGDEDKQKVYIKAINSELKAEEMEAISLQSFEQMLFDAINVVKDQRLEDVEDFKSVVHNLVSKIITNNIANKKYLALMGYEYRIYNGIGIIRDIKTNQDIGTFESIEYLYDRNKRTVNIEEIILSGRTFDDLSEKDRYEFSFYSLDQPLVYSVIGGNNTQILTDEQQVAVDMVGFSMLVDEFAEGHKHYDTVKTSMEFKNIMDGIDEGHPLYVVNHEKFRQSRLAILEESKMKQKQDQIISQFSDIDIEF